MEGATGKEEAMSDRFTDLFFSSENLGKDRSLFSFLVDYTEQEMHDAYNSYGSSDKPLYSGSFKDLLGMHPLIEIDLHTATPKSDNIPMTAIKKIAAYTSVVDEVQGDIRVLHRAAGRYQKVPTNKPPAEHVIIIKKSELCILSSEIEDDTEYEIVFSTPFHDVVRSADIVYVNKVYTEEEIEEMRHKYEDHHDHGRGHCTDPCLRNCRDFQDYVCKIKFANEAALENWIDGDNWEFVMTMSWNQLNSSTSTSYTGRSLKKVFNVNKKSMYDCYTWIGCGGKSPKWVYVASSGTPGVYTVNWNPTLMTDVIKYHWVEMDPDTEFTQTFTSAGGKIKLTPANSPISGEISTGSQTVSIKVTFGSDFMGESLVYYCDESAWPGEEYNTGSFKFTVGD